MVKYIPLQWKNLYFINLKPSTIVEIPEGYSRHLCRHTIWPGACIEQTKLVWKHFKMNLKNNSMFPNFSERILLIHHISFEWVIPPQLTPVTKYLRKCSTKVNKIKAQQLMTELKNTEDIHVHPNITFKLSHLP
jgi:hypothetical protein